MGGQTKAHEPHAACEIILCGPWALTEKLTLLYNNIEWAFNSSDGRVIRASALGAVDSGLIPSWVKPMTSKLVFTASVLDAQHERNSVKNKLASLLVVPLGKVLSGIPPS